MGGGGGGGGGDKLPQFYAEKSSGEFLLLPSKYSHR